MRDKDDHAAYMRDWYNRNKERAAEIAARSYAKHRDARREHMLRKNSKDPDMDRTMALVRHDYRMRTDPVYAAKHRLNGRLQRAHTRYGKQPIAKHFWDGIKDFYVQCPKGKEVDHIEPRFAKVDGAVVACGLHVPWNLQYIEPGDNKRKLDASTAVGSVRTARPKTKTEEDKKAYMRAYYLRHKGLEFKGRT